MKSDTALFSRLWAITARPVLKFLKKTFKRIGNGAFALGARIYYKKSPYYQQMPHRSFADLKKDKGAYGEYLLCYLLRREKGRWLYNLYIPGREEATELDALFICSRGVFLFESKNFSGRIYGLLSQPDWVQSVKTEKGIRKLRFFNPMMQNGAHARALKALLPENTPVYPMVVFGRESTLYTPVAKEQPDKLFCSRDLRKRVSAIKKGMLSADRVDNIHSTLAQYTKIDLRDKLSHLRRAQKRRR